MGGPTIRCQLTERPLTPAGCPDAADADSDGVPDYLDPDPAPIDADGDGFGTDSDTVTACDLPSGYAAATAQWDCDDDDAAIIDEEELLTAAVIESYCCCCVFATNNTLAIYSTANDRSS